MCPDVLRDPFSRVFFPPEAFQRYDSQQGFFFPAAYDSPFKLRDDRAHGFFTGYERAQQQTNDCGNFLHFQAEIDDAGWMNEILDDLPIISNQEIAQLPLEYVSPPFSNLPPLNPTQSLPLEELLRPEVEARDGHCQLQPSPTAFNIQQPATLPVISRPCQQSPTGTPVSRPSRPRAFKHSNKAKQKPRKIPKWARDVSVDAPSEQVEHVLRERQRRDDMSSKIGILEGLLPPCHKRDRASIVHDSVHYVKSLQQGVEELRKRLQVVRKQRNSCHETTTRAFTKAKISVPPEVIQLSFPASSEIPDMSAGNLERLAEKSFYLVEYHIQLEGCSEAAKLRRCKCRRDYLSSAMKMLQQLNVEISRCSVTKMFDHFICVIIVKPHSPTGSAPTASSIAASLETAVAF